MKIIKNREEILELAEKDPVIQATLELTKDNFLTFEQAMMTAVGMLHGQNIGLRETLAHVVTHTGQLPVQNESTPTDSRQLEFPMMGESSMQSAMRTAERLKAIEDWLDQTQPKVNRIEKKDA